jgi:formylmethanofuran dehydrogenase subunit C
LERRPISSTTAARPYIAGETLVVIARNAASAEEIANARILVGNRMEPVGELFTVRKIDDEALRFVGDLTDVVGLARGMDAGQVFVDGSVGDYAGAEMTGGTLTIRGNAGDWAGAAMTGGDLRLHGNVGSHLGSSLPGAKVGMRGGTILIDGSAGADLGRRMRRGLIAVGGDCGDHACTSMLAGAVMAFGQVGAYPGVGMKRGSLVCFAAAPALSPTFLPDGVLPFGWVDVYLGHLERSGFSPAARPRGGRFRKYRGDFLELGKGEILVTA